MFRFSINVAPAYGSLPSDTQIHHLDVCVGLRDISFGILITNGEFTAFCDASPSGKGGFCQKGLDKAPVHVRVGPKNNGALKFTTSAFWGQVVHSFQLLCRFHCFRRIPHLRGGSLGALGFICERVREEHTWREGEADR
jgi:hypothetical protein